MNVSDLINDTLRRASIINEAETASAEQGADALTRLNEMMAEWAGVGIDMGWNPKATTAETADINLEYVSAIKANLGARLCGAYGIAIDPGLAFEADTGYNRLMRQAVLGLIRPVRVAIHGEVDSAFWDITLG